jgi:hypothetical protein
MNTAIKYAPTSLGTFVYATPQLKVQIERYVNGNSMTPLIFTGEMVLVRALLPSLFLKQSMGQT